MRTTAKQFTTKPLVLLGGALLLAGLATAMPAHAEGTDSMNSNSTHKPIKHARTATRNQKKMISKTDPSAVRSNSTAKTQ